jgi:Trk-type K+ transport system membrane component
VSTLVLLVALLLVVVVLLLAGCVAYIVHRHPVWSRPITAAFCAMSVMATAVGVIVAAGSR